MATAIQNISHAAQRQTFKSIIVIFHGLYYLILHCEKNRRYARVRNFAGPQNTTTDFADTENATEEHSQDVDKAI